MQIKPHVPTKAPTAHWKKVWHLPKIRLFQCGNALPTRENLFTGKIVLVPMPTCPLCQKERNCRCTKQVWSVPELNSHISDRRMIVRDRKPYPIALVLWNGRGRFLEQMDCKKFFTISRIPRQQQLPPWLCIKTCWSGMAENQRGGLTSID